jgi:hypothetical protein
MNQLTKDLSEYGLMKNKLLSLLLHPLFIALAISSIIIYFLPDIFTKYRAELKTQEVIPKDIMVYFEDLDGDNISEKILCQTNTSGNASFVIFRENGDIIDQWNFDRKFSTKRKNLQFFDRDKDGFKEIYLITLEKDSLFFNSIEPLHKNNEEKTEIFIDTIRIYDHKYQVQVTRYQFDSHINTPQKAVFLTVTSGLSGYPRNFYKINTQNKKVIRSPYLVNHGFPNYLADLDNDGKSEFLFSNRSSCNTLDPVITDKSDHSSWFTVLDDDLNFLFDPVEFKSPYSSSRIIPVKDRNGKYKIICLEDYRMKENQLDKLLLYSTTGELISEKIIENGKYYIFPDDNECNFILINKVNGKVSFFNCDLKEEKTLTVDPNCSLFPIDINEDGKNEWISFNKGYSKVKIYRSGFINPVSFTIPKGYSHPFLYGIKEMKNTLNELYFQKDSNYYVYKYRENPLYYFKYLFYLGIFLSIWGLLWLARKGQQLQMEKKRAIEDQISQLQIKTLKNQVDPHFVFNAVNTISEMTLSEDKFEADRFISKFSKLMRETLQKSDRITTTLQEEIDYVENYIQLQQIRFNNDFQYQIKKGLNVDYQMQVPNHVIYTYVENAIKHGLSGHAKGNLSIEVRSIPKGISIIIENNGGGIDTSSVREKNSTGNGMKIMEKMYTLYKKLYNKKITHQMTELKDKKGNIVGVSVKVIISK